MDEIKKQLEWWNINFRQELNSSKFDFISRDGSVFVEVKANPEGFRGVHDGLIRIASALQDNPAAYEFRTQLEGNAVNTKDADLIVHPAGNVKSCVEMTKRLLEIGWTRTEQCFPQSQPVQQKLLSRR